MSAVRTRADRATSLSEPARDLSLRNGLLASLTDADRRYFQPLLEWVHLPPATVLCQQGDSVRHVYFPIRGLISLFGTTPNGDVLQVAAIGRRGIVGVAVILEAEESPHQVVAHVPCDAYRLTTSATRDLCRRNPAVRHTLLRATHAQLVTIGDVAMCHRFHTALQRLSGCLLAYAVGTSSDTVALTQHVLADMLGSPRTVVSRAVNQLQDLNAVRQRHGRLEILDRRRISECACECGALEEPKDMTSHR